jgi:outer membrane receptor protein involved in Fe transport
VDIKTYSVFGEVRWNIVERLELAGGLRYTDEKRVESPFNLATGQPTVVPTPELHTKRPSPEVTLTYRPTDDLTMFGAWKRGFKSGSFSVATPAVTGKDNSFGDEKVNGGEAGLKSRLLDRQLAVNVASYCYDYNGLQVGVISPRLAQEPHACRGPGVGCAACQRKCRDRTQGDPDLSALDRLRVLVAARRRPDACQSSVRWPR